MSGTPTEAEIQTQWKNTVAILEAIRNFADGTMAGAGGKFDTLIQSLEGEYTPLELADFVNTTRSGLSTLITPSQATAALTPVMYEYARILATSATLGQGSGYRTPAELFRAIYEWFHANSLSVASRSISYDASVTAGGSNVGNGALTRLTVDENGYNLEACHVEKKMFRCRADQNSGTDKNAEVFEFVGTAASYDSLLRGAYGSGESQRTTIVSKHAGTGNGGSLLTNSSFSEYSATGTPKFTAWTESAGGAQVSQDTVNYYRTHPGAQTNASLKITGGSGIVTLKQPLTAMRVRRLDPNTPYFFRIMVNPTIGSASGGAIVIRVGSQSVTTNVSALSSGWNELTLPLTNVNWFRNFDQDAFDVEIEWSAASTSGYILVDDVIFAPWDLIDGTYWCLRGNAATHTAWAVDDTLTVTDAGGAPGTGKIQWWLFVSGFGYLPSSGSPTFTDPS